MLVALVVVWLVVNLVKDRTPSSSSRSSGLTGPLYALVALGYTLVYGILELINFAHGDVFMIGGMIAASIALEVFDLDRSPALRDAGRGDPRLARGGDGRLRPPQRDHRARRLQAATTRAAPRAADHRDRRLVHPPERRAHLEGHAAGLAAGERAPARRDLHARDCPSASTTRWDRLFVLARHRSRPDRPRVARPLHAPGQGDARHRPGQGRGGDDGDRRQPDDLVHVPRSPARSPARPA